MNTMSEFTGSGDPARSLALLWRTAARPSRGPKPSLDVDQIVVTAVDIADAHGLAELSMRRVAEQLGVGTMSLYTYVPGKAELLDAMVDLVCAETTRGTIRDHLTAGGWRARLERIARDNWDLYQRHPWLLQLATCRPPLGPNIIAKYDYELRAVDGIGLTDVEMDTVLSLIIGHAQTSARMAAESAQVAQRSAMTDEQWWQANEPLFEKTFDPHRFPVAARVGAASGQAHNAASSPAHMFEFGLQLLLDGIESLVLSTAQRRERPGTGLQRFSGTSDWMAGRRDPAW